MLRTIGVAIPTSLFRASAMLLAHNLRVEGSAAGRLRAACRALGVPHTEAPEHDDQAATRMRREIEVDDDAPLAPEEEDDQC
jgi:hypothetical protein